jgi:osmotically-inducible protein OsmY
MTDRELQRHVEDALSWEPSFDAADIGVSVDNAVVTLRGDVATYAARAAAECVTLGVWGVKAVADDLNVRLPGQYQRTDSDIAQAAVNALQWNTVVPADRISVAVSG